MRRLRTHICLVCACLAPAACPAATPLLVVLKETGEERQGVPVYTEDTAAGPVIAALEQGLSGRLLRLYRCEQSFLAGLEGSEPEPAYLLLSHHQGGFPRFGFYLGDRDERHAGYVDLQRGLPLAGRFGALDQIFPHELAHVIVRQLAGEPPDGGCNQVHAIGVTTDRVIAFQEGFAEHFQVMAIDDSEADPTTRAVAQDERAWRQARARLRSYRRALSARWSPASRPRMTFPLWFSRVEQAMRYHSVKSNAFAFEPVLQRRLLEAADPWPAYLIQNVGPGDPALPGAVARSVSRRLACEGVVSAFFVRWAQDHEVRSRFADEDVYARFGVERADVDSLDNVYLKLFEVLYASRPVDTVELVRAYRERFPEERAAVDSLVRATFSADSLHADPSLWITDTRFEVGTSLFDQFRSAPRPHVFDLNAASMLDLMAIPGIDGALAARILEHAPYGRVEDLEQIEGIPPAVARRFDDMASEETRARAAALEQSAMLRLRAILMAYVWRALGCMAAAAVAGALLYRRLRPSTWRRAIPAGILAAFFGLVGAWVLDSPPALAAVLSPVVLGGVPTAGWSLVRTRTPGSVVRTLAAWAAAAIPAALLVQPWM